MAFSQPVQRSSTDFVSGLYCSLSPSCGRVQHEQWEMSMAPGMLLAVSMKGLLCWVVVFKEKLLVPLFTNSERDASPGNSLVGVRTENARVFYPGRSECSYRRESLTWERRVAIVREHNRAAGVVWKASAMRRIVVSRVGTLPRTISEMVCCGMPKAAAAWCWLPSWVAIASKIKSRIVKLNGVVCGVCDFSLDRSRG